MLGCDLCDLDLWPWPFACTLLLSLVITPENFMMIRWWEHSQKGVTDRQTDRRTKGQTENTICRAAWSQLKIIGHPFYAASSFLHHFIAISEFKLELQSRNIKFGSKSMIFLSSLTLKFHRKLSKIIGHLLCFFKLCATFQTIGKLKLELQSGNAWSWSKSAFFCPVWPWNLTDDLEK